MIVSLLELVNKLLKHLTRCHKGTVVPHSMSASNKCLNVGTNKEL